MPRFISTMLPLGLQLMSHIHPPRGGDESNGTLQGWRLHLIDEEFVEGRRLPGMAPVKRGGIVHEAPGRVKVSVARVGVPPRRQALPVLPRQQHAVRRSRRQLACARDPTTGLVWSFTLRRHARNPPVLLLTVEAGRSSTPSPPPAGRHAHPSSCTSSW